MDTKTFWIRVRNLEKELAGPGAEVFHEPDGRISRVVGGNADAVIVSLDTPDGGVAGKVNDCPRLAAAKAIVYGFARVATYDEAQAFYAGRDVKIAAARRAAQAKQITVQVAETLQAQAQVTTDIVPLPVAPVASAPVAAAQEKGTKGSSSKRSNTDAD